MRLAMILVVSTHHASFDERDRAMAFESFGPVKEGPHLTGWSLENMGAFYNRGWVLRVHPEIAKHDLSEFSAGMRKVIELAIGNEAQYIHFDCMAETTPGVPEYRH